MSAWKTGVWKQGVWKASVWGCGTAAWSIKRMFIVAIENRYYTVARE